MTEIREEMIDLIKANLIGPNPKEGFTQDNGQEILFFESPLQTYVAGILFPQILEPEFIQDEEILNDEDSDNSNSIKIDEHKKTESTSSNTKCYPEPIIEAETSKINSYKQSALGITVCVPKSISYSPAAKAFKYSEYDSRAKVLSASTRKTLAFGKSFFISSSNL